MKSVSLRDIKQGYHGLKRIAQKCVRKGDYAKAMDYIGHCTTVASQFNWIYADDELEELLDEIAKSQIDNSFVGDYEADENHWVFFDDYCTSYVLALQWMRALSKTGKIILYITSQFSLDGSRNISILPEIEKLPNVIIEVVPDGSFYERTNHVFSAIVKFKASRIILHKAMNSLIQLPLCKLPETIKVYNINLGDQFFWLGTRHIDFNIEFRQFGASVSVHRRGFNEDQLLMVPFYPSNDNRPFDGFPDGCYGKIVIFSGGDYYKTIDESGTFWRLVKQILDKHKNVVFLFATKRGPRGSDFVATFINSNHYEDRFYYIGFRKDIYQVFAHCDIYMGTCPVSGSLMSQLAAINSKPILQFYPEGTPDDETEQVLCINERFNISYQSEAEFLKEADNLINDANYRIKQGERLRASMIQPKQFETIVERTMFTNKSQMPIDSPFINYDMLNKRWLMLERKGFTNAGAFIRSLLGKKYSLCYAPCLMMKCYFCSR